MAKKFKIIESREPNTEVLSFRIGKSAYSKLEKRAEASGSTVSTVARKLILESLDEGLFLPGDSLKGTSDFVVMLTDGPMTNEMVEARIKKLVQGKTDREVSPPP